MKPTIKNALIVTVFELLGEVCVLIEAPLEVPVQSVSVTVWVIGRAERVCLLFQWSLESQSPHSPGIPQKRYTHVSHTNSNEVHAEHTVVLRFHLKYIAKTLDPFTTSNVLVTLVTT